MIVVVDDEEAIVDTVVTLMEEHGAIGFTNPVEACSYIKAHLPEIDVIVTDHSMPIMKGSELIKATRMMGYAGKIIMQTGMEDVSCTLDIIDFENDLGIKNKTVFKEKPLPGLDRIILDAIKK